MPLELLPHPKRRERRKYGRWFTSCKTWKRSDAAALLKSIGSKVPLFSSHPVVPRSAKADITRGKADDICMIASSASPARSPAVRVDDASLVGTGISMHIMLDKWIL